MACVKCGELVEEELRVPFRECSHRVHADCLMDDPNPNYKKCGLCLGYYAPLSSSSSVSIGEPHLAGNRDWVLNPGKKSGASVLSAVGSLLPFRAAQKQAETPLSLIQQRKPLDRIMSENNFGLDHFLEAGVTMRDFLVNGYQWEDLLVFEDLSKKGAKRALQAVSSGLKTTANDFRDYPDALPFAAVKEHTRFKTSDLCRLFGLEFPQGGGQMTGEPLHGGFLQCCGDRNWDVSDCVETFGLVFSDLENMGLAYTHQYDDLMAGLSEVEAAKMDKALKVSEQQLKKLIDLEALEAAALEREASIKQRIALAAAAPEEISSEEEISPTISYIRKPPFNPPPPQEPVPLVERRVRTRAKLHGLK